ncbi:MAG TPA: NAD-dependent epimerase/dehydratase family protein [Bryobacteraceae bacterium]|nr:NAD-dependent epimerase/dehydratase family protein [Bryobacteraceae bacterium]
MRQLRAPTLWITGAAGFSARHLARYLRQHKSDLKLIGIERFPARNADFDEIHKIDITDAAAIRRLARLRSPDRIFHLAAAMPPCDDADLWRINVGGTQTLFQGVAEDAKSSLRILTIGSAAEYHPLRRNLRETDRCGGESSYGRSKWAQTMIALACGRELGIDVIVARTFNLLGPGLSTILVAGSLAAQFASKGAIKIGDTRPARDFVDIRDAVRAYCLICERGKPGQVYNVSTGNSTTVEKLLTLFTEAAGSNRAIHRKTVAPGHADQLRVCGDYTKLRRLGWSPSISVKQSVHDMLAHTQAQ